MQKRCHTYKRIQRRRARIAHLLIYLFFPFSLLAQQNWFVDGYHGGVYGHYPLEGYTQFLVDQLYEHPEWCIGLEIEPETWDSVLVHTPEAYRRFSELSGSRQMEYTNPSYAQSYLYCIQGESIIRQFQHGIGHLQKHFPNIRFTTYACEEPCYTSCLPTILPQLGIRYISLKCPDTCWGGYAAAFGGSFVRLQGPAGNSMLCVPRYACEDFEPNSKWQTMAWRNNGAYWRACHEAGIENPVGMCYQDAGWNNGPWIGYGENVSHGTHYILWSDYFERFGSEYVAPIHRFSQEEVCPGLMWGSQILQRLAQQVRKSENTLLQAEKIATQKRFLSGKEMPQESMDEAWRMLLLSQHHDCWIVPYNKLNERGNWAQNVALWTKSADSLAHEVMGKEGLLFFNTTAQPRHELVVLPEGYVEVDLPAFGSTSRYRHVSQPCKIRLTPDKAYMESNLYRLVFNLRKGGTIEQFYDKRTKTDYAPKGVGGEMGEIRGYGVANQSVSASVDEKGRLCLTNSLYTETVSLRKDNPLVDFDLDIHWKGGERVGGDSFYDTRSMLRFMLPLPMQRTQLYKSAPFDVCQSMQDHSYYTDWHDIRHNLILDWVDLYDAAHNRGFSVFSDHTTSYTWAPDEPFSLTLQYAGPGLWNRDYAIVGPSHIHFAFMPHEGKWDEASVPLFSQRWNEPVQCIEGETDAKTVSWLNLEGTGYLLSAAIPSKDSFTLRLFNAMGDESLRTVLLPAGVDRVEEVDLLGRCLKELPVSRKKGQVGVQLSMPRFGLLTLRCVFREGVEVHI